ncbi:MAG TPA: FTR1 family protein [Candidatus Micrarchaeia archaeon]|nr:FTR1 family protein [Candidatus Micrarchaeia archaeon]
MIPGFVIFLREGVEASMIVAILLAYLDRAGQRRHFRDVLLGVGAACLLAGAGGLAAFLTLRHYAGSTAQTVFETITYLVAFVLLTYMTFWMRRHARTLSTELRTRIDQALGRRARWGLALLAFQAVGREGLETVVFTLAIVFAAATPGGAPRPGAGGAALVLVGGGLGLAAALLIATAIYRLGRRLNLGRFFTAVGVLLMVFAAGLLADAVENLQQQGWMPVLAHPLWDSGHWLAEASPLGDILHTLFGYAARPTILQLAAWALYLAVALSAFLGLRPRLSRRPRPAST